MAGSDLFHFDVPPLNLAFRATAVYLFVLILLRISGKRELGQMGATEFVAVLLISNAVQNAMNGGDNSLVGGLVLAAVLILLSWAISNLTYSSRKFQRIFEGSPRLLIHEGKVIEKAMKKERLSPNELHLLLRKQGIDRVHEVKTGILESDGTMSIIRYSDLGPGAGGGESKTELQHPKLK